MPTTRTRLRRGDVAEEQQFRDAMATICTPVAVATAMDGELPHGTTVSAFASMSLRPPMVMVALDRNSALLGLIRGTDSFGVNVLASGQSSLALGFAKKGTDKFDGVNWHLQAGLPRLAGVQAWLACAVHRLIDGGDHVIALGAIREAETTETAPLTYWRRCFGTHRELV